MVGGWVRTFVGHVAVVLAFSGPLSTAGIYLARIVVVDHQNVSYRRMGSLVAPEPCNARARLRSAPRAAFRMRSSDRWPSRGGIGDRQRKVSCRSRRRVRRCAAGSRDDGTSAASPVPGRTTSNGTILLDAVPYASRVRTACRGWRRPPRPIAGSRRSADRNSGWMPGCRWPSMRRQTPLPTRSKLGPS